MRLCETGTVMILQCNVLIGIIMTFKILDVITFVRFLSFLGTQVIVIENSITPFESISQTKYSIFYGWCVSYYLLRNGNMLSAI